MDYIRLKKTLIAVFDHFLSCHDMAELEEMMQAFEAGKSLVIKLPEAVDRGDYSDDVFTREEQRKSDDVFTREEQRKSDDVFTREEQKRSDIEMAAPEPKKTVSRVRRRKPKSAMKTDMKQIKICDVPVLIDLSKLSKDKREVLKEAMSGDHHAQIHDFKMSDIHGFAKLRVFKVIEGQDAVPSSEILRCAQNKSSVSFGGDQTKNASDRILKENLIQKIMFEIKKHKDPP